MKGFNSNFATAVIGISLLMACSTSNSSENMNKKDDRDTKILDTIGSDISSNNAAHSIRVQSNNSVQGPYEMMHIAFTGSPEVHEIKPLLEAVIENYDLPKTEETRLKVGSMLVSLRKGSARGVTEMQILRHIHEHGSNKISLPDQAGLSITLLELNM